jgi:[calcium/calmodulin-dependent protein kinase] kinase
MRKMLEKKPETRIQMEEIRVRVAICLALLLTFVKDHPWVTDDGSEPMIPTEDNLYYVGKHVEEPTQEELGNAIGTLRGVL